MKIKRILLAVLLVAMVFIVNAQEETPEVPDEVVVTQVAQPTPAPQFDESTQQYVFDTLMNNFWTIIGLLVAVIAGWVFARMNGIQTPTLQQLSSGALTFATMLDYLERLDITDPNADLLIHQLSEAIKAEASRMGTQPDLILLKPPKE